MRLRERGQLRILDFDTESLAAGFADPAWVPQTITCWAYAWTDDRNVHVRALPVASQFNHNRRKAFLRPLLAAIAEADILTGQNLLRHDLPLLNAECLLLGLPTLNPVLVQDTMRHIPKTKGFKKGQDNMSAAFGVKEEKMPLNWAQWQQAYAEPGLPIVKERCATDVEGHMALRDAMLERGVLGAPRMWRP